MTESQGARGQAQPNTSPSVSSTNAGQAHDATLPHVAASPTMPAADLPSPPLVVGSRFDTYELVEKLGEGGMGSVWKARHVKLDKLVALKVLPVHLMRDPEAVRRFEREMRAVGKLDHPHVVRAMDAGEVGGLHFLVMEFVEGTDLSKYVQSRGPRSIADACVMVRHAALGLAAAHAQGLIHRDIKPSNLLLSKQGQVKVLDLGLARLMDDGPEARQLTQSGQVLGTPDYMAPEQWDNTHAVDHRADLYALGCTLCFLLTGRAPFGDERHSTMPQKMKGHLLEPTPRLRELCHDVPQELDDLYMRLLEKEPTQRRITAEETASLLKAIAQQQSTKASFPSTVIQPKNPTCVAPTQTGADEPVTTASPTATRIELQPRSASQPVVIPPQQRRSWVVAAAGGAAVLLVLLGVIVIRIANKDGTTRELRVPEEATVEVLKDGKTVAKVDPAKEAPDAVAATPGLASRSTTAPPLAIAPFNAARARAHQEAWARYLNVPIEFTNSIGMKFRLIPPGEFTMGMTQRDAEAIAALNPTDESWSTMALSSAPPHQVRLTRAYYLGTYEVTQEQYQRIVGTNPSYFSASGAGQDEFKDDDPRHLPVETVSFGDAVDFCIRLSKHEKLKPVYFSDNHVVTVLSGDGYRLPTEAEWEYACRAGTNTAWFHGEQESALGTVAWFGGNADGRMHMVGQLKANPFGLYDVHGNVWEWCQDWHDAQAYAKRGPGPTEDPQGAASGEARALRGGVWFHDSATCRSAFRGARDLDFRFHNLGFRVLASVNVAQGARDDATKVASLPKDTSVDLQQGEPTKSGAKAVPSDLPSGAPSTAAPPLAIAPFDEVQAHAHQEAWAKYLNVPVEFANSIGMKFQLIPPGEFTMGMTNKDAEAIAALNPADEMWRTMALSSAPPHQVRLTQAYYLSTHEVTQRHYEQVIGTNPSFFSAKGDGKELVKDEEPRQHPVEMISFGDAAEFCIQLSKREKLKPAYVNDKNAITLAPGDGYRLPTEAEWEHACRAGTNTAWYHGDKASELATVAWWGGNAGGRTHAVGQLKANPFGLYDMHGNVWEWCQNWHDAQPSTTPGTGPSLDPQGPRMGSGRVVRGGRFGDNAAFCRSAFRHALDVDARLLGNGIRVVVSVSGARADR